MQNQEENKKEEEIFKVEQKKEEEKEKEVKEEDEKNNNEEGDVEKEKKEGQKKRKKVIKKVVKKKGKGEKREAMILTIIHMQKEKEKELEEKLLKEIIEREKKEKEEEEKRQKEEELRKKEEEQKIIEEKRILRLKELARREKELAIIEENRKKTEEMLKKEGTDLKTILDNLKTKFFFKKPKKTKNNLKTKQKEEKKEEQKIDNDNKNEAQEKEEEKKEEYKEVKEKIPKEIKIKAKIRAPIVCVLGHVDVGKTKILDKLRHTNIQNGEPGGITQQIGATFIPIENIQTHLTKISRKFQIETNIPGILLIDTPGHSTFNNLRSRGSSLCDIAILVVNINRGIEEQTIESINLLRMRKTPFIVALNQIDRFYLWKSNEWSGFQDSFKKQQSYTKRLFYDRLEQNKNHFIKNNFNTELYYKNKNMKEYVNLVPTSAISGEGLPDLMGLLVYLSQNFLYKQIIFKEEVNCSVFEVKNFRNLGTTIDVLLVNGTLHVGDKIVIGGKEPIKTTIKMILLPKAMKELGKKGDFDYHNEISGAICAKLFCLDLKNALPGSPLYVYKTEEEAEKYCEEIKKDFNSIIHNYISKGELAMMVQASTLGSLEAILKYLEEQKVKVSNVGVGDLYRKDVFLFQTMHSQDITVKKGDLVILCFDNKVLPEAQEFADKNGIQILVDDVIYHLFDKLKKFKLERKKVKEKEAVFPCFLKTEKLLKIKNPITLVVSVVEGVLKLGTPIYYVEKNLPIGVVASIEKEKKPINNVKPNDGEVIITIKTEDPSVADEVNFDENSNFVSHITRYSIEILKYYFREDMTTNDWKLIIKIKNILNIV